VVTARLDEDTVRRWIDPSGAGTRSGFSRKLGHLPERTARRLRYSR
jgi:hypothetical protein